VIMMRKRNLTAKLYVEKKRWLRTKTSREKDEAKGVIQEKGSLVPIDARVLEDFGRDRERETGPATEKKRSPKEKGP